MRQLLQLIKIHFIEILREPGVIFWGIGFPILMAWGLGMAFNRSPEIRKDIAIINSDSDSKIMKFIDENAQASWTLDSLRSYNLVIEDQVFGKNTFRFIPLSEDQAIIGMKRGKYQLLIHSSVDSIFFKMDPANPDARLLQLQLSGLLEESNNGSSSSGSFHLTTANIEPMKMQGTRYVDFLVPGLLGMTVMMAIMWGLSYTIIERRKGMMLRRMIATPMKKSNLLIAHMTARLSMNFLEALILLLFAVFYFDLKIQGSWAALFLVFISGNIAFTGIAILFSSRTSKTEIGNAFINLVTMPMMILSGIFFSYQNFPEWTIPIIQKLPLTMMADSFRSIINEAAGVSDVMSNVLTLSLGGILTFIIGMRVFKWY